MAGKDFYLYISGKCVKVTEEIYREYYRAKDEEHYFMEKLKKGISSLTRTLKKSGMFPDASSLMSSL